MADYPVPRNGIAYIFYAGLPSQANVLVFQSNPTIAAGDFKLSTDGGTLNNLTTLPTVTPAAGKMVKFSLSAAEMTGDNITVVCSDAAGAEWCDQVFNIQTSARGVADLAYPATTGRSMVVDASGLVDANAVKLGPTGSGTAQTARDVGLSVLISSGASTGQLDVTSGVVKANLAQILGTAITETAGQIAAAFKKVFDVAAATFTALSVNQTGDSYPRIGAPAGASIAADLAEIEGETDTLIAGVVVTTNNDKTGYSLSGTQSFNNTGQTSNTPIAMIVHSGTATAGGATTITLQNTASATTDLYKGNYVLITGGTGAGQARTITGYNGGTFVATVSRAWATNPDNTSVYSVIGNPHPALDANLAVTTGTYTGNTPQTGDAYARLGAPAGASVSADILEANADLDEIITTVGAAGSGLTAIPDTATVTEIGADVDELITTVGAAGAGLTAIPVVAHVTLVDTVTTLTGNTPQTGDSYARLGAPAGVSIAADIAEIEAETDTIAAAPTVTAIRQEMDTNSTKLAFLTGDSFTRLGAPVGVSISADIAEVEGETDSLLATLGVSGAGLTALGDARIANLDVASSTLATATNMTEANADLDEIITTLGAAGAGLTAIPDSATLTEVGADVDELITTIGVAGAGLTAVTASLDFNHILSNTPLAGSLEEALVAARALGIGKMLLTPPTTNPGTGTVALYSPNGTLILSQVVTTDASGNLISRI